MDGKTYHRIKQAQQCWTCYSTKNMWQRLHEKDSYPSNYQYCRRKNTNWIHAYNQKGLNGLATNLGGRPGGNPIWDISMFDTLVKEINKQTQYWSIPLMQKWIENKYKKDIPESTIWYHMTSLNYSYKSARPHPKEGDVKAQLEFKKRGLLKR